MFLLDDVSALVAPEQPWTVREEVGVAVFP